MKNLNELLEEKQGYYNIFLKLDNTIQEFEKPVSLSCEEYKTYKAMMREGKEEEAQNYYKEIKAKYAENEKELNNLEKQLDVYRLSNNLIDCNIIIVFTNLYKEKILNILNKYVKKRVGEKTKEKIENEIKALDENIISVYVGIGEYLHYNFIRIYYNKTRVKIEFSKINNDNWLNENGEKIQDIDSYISNKYNYIDDIKELAIQKINDKKKIKKEVEEQIKQLKKKIREFNKFYCSNEEFKIDEYALFK